MKAAQRLICVVVVLVVSVWGSPFAKAQNTISTVAGGGNPSGAATSADVITPSGVVVDHLGNLYIGQFQGSQVFKVTPAGVISVFAGRNFFGFGGDGGPATNAVFSQTIRLAFDANENLYVADYTNHRVRRIDANTGIVTTVAGSATQCPISPSPACGDGGLATSASLNTPEAVAFDSAGNMFIADHFTARVRRVDANSGIITTVAGNGNFCIALPCGDGGPATQAQLTPRGVAVDAGGNVFVADGNRIRRIDASTGIITTVATPPDTVSFLMFESSGNLLATGVTTVYRVNAQTFAITTLAGTPTLTESGDGGPAIDAGLADPFSVAEDAAGNIYVGQLGGNHVRKIDTTPQHIITTFAGGGSGGDGGPATSAILGFPNGIALDSQGNQYLVDQANNRIRRVDGTTHTITTVAGNGTSQSSGDGGLALNAGLSLPTNAGGIAFDSSGNLFIADFLSNEIRRVDLSSGTISLFAGGALCTDATTPCGDGGAATAAGLFNPSGLAFDHFDNLFIADSSDYRVRRVDAATGVISTVAGNGTPCADPTTACGDGGPATAANLGSNDLSMSVAVDGAGNLFIADSFNFKIRRVDATSGVITTVAGTGTECLDPTLACGDGGSATSAQLFFPLGIVVDGSGNLYVGDAIHVRRIDAVTHTIASVAGNSTGGFSGDGGPALSAGLNSVRGLALGASGNLFIADGLNNRIRLLKLSPVAAFAGTIIGFGSQQVGVQSAPQTVTLSNNGGDVLHISSITVSGSGFASTNTCSGNQVAPGQSCTISVTFTPTGSGPFSGSLSIATNDSTTPVMTYSLAGTGAGATLSSIAVTPANPTISAGGTQQFTATGTFSDNSTQNLTNSATWSSTNTGAATISASGLATGVGVGQTTIKATSGTVNGSTNLTVTSAGPSSCSPGDSVWIGGASGNWSAASNWSTDVVPTSGAHVCINNSQSPASSVTLDVSVSIGGLTINPGNSLTIGNGQELVAAGTISNAGLITVFSNNTNTFLTFNGAVTLTGGGTLTLNQVLSNGQPILRNANGGTVTNVNNLIQGAGQFGNNGLTITNQAAGVINANGTQPLLFNSGSLTNQGLIEATAGGTLRVSVTVANQGGTFLSTGANSAVQLLAGTTIRGGTVSGTASGVLGSIGGNAIVLDGATAGAVTIAGTYTVAGSSETIVSGTINNTGVIQLLSNNTNTFLTFSGAVTLTGGGTVTLSQAISNGQPILRNANSGVLNNVNNLIQGSGQFGNNGLIINNQAAGVINANGAFPLMFNSGTVTSLGLIEASAGGVLQVSVTVNNANSTLLATGANSNVQLLGGSLVVGGTIKTLSGGAIGSTLGATVRLDGATQGALTIVGTFTDANNSETVVSGTINNTGTILMLSNNSNTFLTFSAGVTLTGGGTVVMSQAISNGQPVLRNANGGALNNVNNLIEGSGQIGNNGLVITNQPGGVINANGAFLMQFNSGTVTNLGLIETSGGGVLQISVLVVNKTATLLSTGPGSAIQLLGGCTIQGGTLSDASGGTVTGTSTISLDGASQGALTLTGTYTVANNTETLLTGTINNTGTIQVLSNNSNSFLTFNGPVTLTGSGTVIMSQAISNGQPVLRNASGGVLDNINNLIQGAGQIGNNGLVINNHVAGVINANGAFPIQFNAGTVTNQNLIEATAGGSIVVSVLIINKAAVLTATGANSSIQLTGGANIQGGTLSSAASGFAGSISTIVLDGSTASGAVTLGGTFVISNNTETIVVGTINNTGNIQLLSNNSNTFLTIAGPVTLTGGGSITMSQAISNGQPVLRNASGGNLTNVNNVIQGSGQLGNNGLIVTNGPAGVIAANGAFPLQMSNATFVNQGLFVDNGSSAPGVVTTTSYSQASSGRFEVAIGGLTAGSQYSQLQNNGTATLSGNLDIVFRNGFQPASGQQFTIVTSSAISGQFAGINSAGLPNGLGWTATYNPGSVVITAGPVAAGPSTLTVTDLGTGTGTVTDDLGLISCTTTGGVISGTCSANYATGSVVTLTATPGVGSGFSGWSTCAGTGQCSVTMNANQGVSATFVPVGSSFALNVSLIGTGNGTVTDNLEQISCTNTAGVTSGTCSATYPAGTVVSLSASATQPSTFGGWMGACSGVGACNVTMNSSQNVTASFIPPPQMISLPFPVGSNVTQMAAYDCPSNPNPSPNNPCLDPNAHALALGVSQVTTPFTLTVQATEVPPNVADGVCPSGATPAQDFDCRFKSFFAFQTLNNGDTIVPLCYPFANGNCVHYTVFFQTPGTEPDPSWYTGPVDWSITWNNDGFVPPAPYTGSTPRLYDDPDGFVLPNSPYGTDCNTPMQVGNPGTATNPAIFCQFVFDITTFYDPNKKVDAGIGGKTKVFNDVVVAIPPANAAFVTVTSAPDAATVTAGSPIGFTITIANSSGGTASNATLNDLLPAASGLNWSISPAYSGPGTCAITGAVGAQVLNCSFGNVGPNTSFSLHVLSPSSSVGPVTNSATIVVANQQLLSIASITVQPVTAAFSGLTQSQAIPVGTSAVTLGGIIGGGNSFPAAGETVSVTINGVAHPATIGTGGAFSLSFPTANIPASATPYPITYSFAGDSIFGAVNDSSTALTVNAVAGSFTLTVSLIGTGNGTVFDNFEQLNCTNTAGVISGNCTASYTAGAVVSLTASATQPSTFGGWLGACTGVDTCSVTMNSSQSVTASFVPPPQIITLPFGVGTNVSEMATYDCPSNPNPTPNNPCLDPNAHALALGVSQVITPFTLTVQATEVPPNVADGGCPQGSTPAQDFDCRFKSFFTYQTKSDGSSVVPLCYPYANGNCVHYTVFFQTPGTEPDLSWYTGPVDWTITWNNDGFVPPAPYTGSTPRLYDDPDGFVLPNSPYGTDCNTPMQVGNPGTPTNPAIFCQFVFDITTFYDPNKKVDAGIGGKTKVFNDVVVAIPPANAAFVTVTSAPDAATVTAGSPIGFTITIANNSAGTASNATLNDPLPAGTNVSWSISPAYAGPGTCAIAGAAGAQVLNCSFGNVAPNASFSVHVLSASSSAGSYLNASTVTAANQQILSIANVTVQASSSLLAFSALTPSQSITYRTASINLSGKLSTGTSFPAAGEKVTVGINGSTQLVTIGASGGFTTTFSTARIPASATPYPITYSFAGDATYGPVSDASTNLTVTIANQTITFGTLPASAAYGSTFTASATASSGLPVSIAASGACIISGSTVTINVGSSTCSLTATQAGNTNYSPVSALKTVAATKASSTTAITANAPNPSAISQAVTVSFSVSGVSKPTGSVKVTASTGENCSGTLAAGTGSCVLTFTTSGVRTLTAAYAGDANFSNSTSASVSQTVNGSSTSTLQISPTSIDFGQVQLGSLEVKRVALTNTGTSSVKISNVAIRNVPGGDSDDFHSFSLCPSSLAPGKVCAIVLAFIPDRDDVGTSSAFLAITDSAVGSPQTVALKATTINPRASLQPRSLSFGTQKVGTTSSSQSLTLTNTGTTPLILSGLSVNGDFSISGTSTCKSGLSISAGHSCRTDVKFSPKRKGQRSGEIIINDNALFSPQVAFLSGQGK